MAFNWGPVPPHYIDWGDFHKVFFFLPKTCQFAVIFFSFFGSGLILAGIFAGLYFGVIKSWWESFREEVHETHRSFHPWPPGSAKWQLQQFLKGEGAPPADVSSPKAEKETPPRPPMETPQPLQPLTIAVPASPNALPSQWPRQLQSPSSQLYARPREFSPSRTAEPQLVSPGYSSVSRPGETIALEAVTVRTTTTTRRTTTLSPVRPYTNV